MTRSTLRFGIMLLAGCATGRQTLRSAPIDVVHAAFVEAGLKAETMSDDEVVGTEVRPASFGERAWLDASRRADRFHPTRTIIPGAVSHVFTVTGSRRQTWLGARTEVNLRVLLCDEGMVAGASMEPLPGGCSYLEPDEVDLARFVAVVAAVERHVDVGVPR